MASTPLNVRMEGGGEWETQGHLVALSFRPGHPPPEKGVTGAALIKRDQSEEIDTRPNKVWFGEAAVFTRKNCMPKYGSRGIEVYRPTGGVEGDVE